MNFGKGIPFPIQPGDEASLSGFWPSQHGPCGLPIDSSGNLVAGSNWQEFTGGGGGGGGTVYQQPPEVQNHNTTAHNFSGASQVGVPEVAGDSSGDRSHGLNQISDVYGQPLGSGGGSQSSSWDELLTLMKAPPAVPDNNMVNNSTRAANGLRMPPPQARASYAVREGGAGNSSLNVPAGSVMPSSHAQGVNLMQYMMKATAMANRNEITNKSRLSANGYGVPNAYPQECSNQSQPHAANSTSLDQSRYIALMQRQRNSLSSILQDGAPVSNQPYRNLNYTNVGAVSSITGISPKFAPLTPQQTKGNHQYPATNSFSALQNLNQCSVVQNNMAASSAEFTPATPQTVKITDHHESPVAPNLSIHQTQNQDSIQQESLAASIENGSIIQNGEEMVHKVLDSSSAAIGSLFAERNSSDNEDNNEIDVNKTPSGKTPKRRKHRPKVIRENKPPSRRQPAKAKMGPDGTPVPKRKYVRKNKSGTAETPRTDCQEKADTVAKTPQTDCQKADAVAKPTSQPCRRSLNFEMEDNVMNRTNLSGQEKGPYRTGENNFHNVNVQEAGLLIGSNLGRGLNSHPQREQGLLIHGSEEAGITAGYGQSVSETQQEKSPQWNRYMHQSQLIMRDLLMGNSFMRAGNEAERATDRFKTTANDVSAHQTLYAAVNQSQLQLTIPENIQRTRQRLLMLVEERQKRALEHIQSRGYKRDFGCTRENEGFSHPTNNMSSQSQCKELFYNDHNGHNSRLGQYSLETYKKKKIERLQHTVNSSIQNSARFAEMCSSHNQTSINTMNHFEEMNGGFLKSHRSNNFKKPNNDLCLLSSGLNADSALPHAFPLRQPITSGVSLGQEKQTGREDKISALAHVTNSLKAQAYSMRNKMLDKSFSRTATLATETINSNSHAIVSKKKHIGSPIRPKLMENNPGSHVKQKNMISVDDITHQLEYLNLNSTKEMVSDDQKALIIYNADGTIIPSEGFDPLKRQKLRPKVDINAETNRLWNLLMGKEASNAETDEEKAKYWEEERKVFRGRADSFIARMHLVQGDRRFSPWKGSVVDSVIGVFLTQNVTDHLSSSAFMSLAARFPPRSIRRDIASGSNKPDMLVEEPEICIIEINDNTEEDQRLNQAIYNKIPCEASDQQKQTPASVDGIQPSVKASNWRSDEVISSQDSSESANGYANGVVQSIYESDPKADCPANGFQPISRYSSTGSVIEDIENFIRFPNFASQESGRSYQEIDNSGHLRIQHAEASKQKQYDGVNVSDFTTDPFPFDLNRPQLQAPDIPFTSSCLPMVGGLETYDIDCCDVLNNQQNMSLYSSAASDYMGIASIGIDRQIQGSVPPLQNIRTWSIEPPTKNPNTSPRKNIDQKNSTEMAAKCQHQENAYYGHEQDKNLNTQFGSKPDKEPHHRQSTMVESDITEDELQIHASSNQNSIYAANKAVESKLIQEGHSSEASSRTKKNVSKEKGRKAMGDKERAIDWDSLRKEVKSSGRLRERSEDSMDSLDYEALRHADIKDISDAIKERGMNIMLAERMKAFLNRMVKDHGSIDLEWLRDAPPDKAKDYLLSIRGLGLKSVECIRLLTLHQHAFPVDTNVGRIAVRLGWVPLQPLPESLQLHLLEMYPVLESIQKYLWPRLCTLDQRTLYELHYQLITFGKVFCTKGKPNCNACPMRGECRHFASAFASSRLALPGPEEKSIVVSDIPIESSRNSSAAVSPMPLYSLQNVPSEEATAANKTCEPIVEEPATPEPDATEFSLTDIEDAFYEDPDEIPTIRLNVEEFTQNLQNFMQENMELQEADMSKALVALNPNAASIPTPKLKNVSRLRTEHQVYELPDSHPLLRELDKREPDDPSPYLLAIWTPGETANSIQPSEGTCGYQESGKLCSEKTCFTCNSIRESDSQTVRGTLLIPCRTAMRGKFPLNGTYFQVNEVFADHESSLKPIDVPRAWIWNLPRRTVYFGTTVTTIFKGMTTEDIQYSFWRGSVCVRGFDRKTRAPRPLIARLHFPASKQARGRKEIKKNKQSVGGRTDGTGNST